MLEYKNITLKPHHNVGGGTVTGTLIALIQNMIFSFPCDIVDIIMPFSSSIQNHFLILHVSQHLFSLP